MFPTGPPMGNANQMGGGMFPANGGGGMDNLFPGAAPSDPNTFFTQENSNIKC